MTTTATIARLMLGMTILTLALAVWVLAANLARISTPGVKAITITGGLLNLALAAWLAVAIWIAP